MGVTISHAIGIKKKHIKGALDRTEKVAEQVKKEQANFLEVPMEIRRLSDTKLLIDIDNCETLSFEFATYEEHLEEEKQDGFSYAVNILQDEFSEKALWGNKEHLARFPEQQLVWSVAFCKTQFIEKLVTHKWVADITRSLAMHADYARVDDEGSYYHSGELKDAEGAIVEVGDLINRMASELGDQQGSGRNLKVRKKSK